MNFSDLGADGIKITTEQLSLKGDNELMYRANYSAENSLSVLKPIADFRIKRSKRLI